MASLRFVNVGWDVCLWLVRAGGPGECMAIDGLSCDGCVMGSYGMGYDGGLKNIQTDNITPSSLHSWCSLSVQTRIAPIPVSLARGPSRALS